MLPKKVAAQVFSLITAKSFELVKASVAEIFAEFEFVVAAVGVNVFKPFSRPHGVNEFSDKSLFGHCWSAS